MNNIINQIKTHSPAYIAVALVVLNALEQSGTISLNVKLVVAVNAVLAAFGLGVIHFRQQVSSKK